MDGLVIKDPEKVPPPQDDNLLVSFIVVIILIVTGQFWFTAAKHFAEERLGKLTSSALAIIAIGVSIFFFLVLRWTGLPFRSAY